MPSIRESTSADLSRYESVDASASLTVAPATSLEPGRSSYMRCPIPAVAASPDALRQFYLGGQVPQLRLVIPSTQPISGSTGTVIQNTTVVSSSSSTSSSAASVVAQNAGITTPVLNPGQSFRSTMQISRSFQLLSVSANKASRIRLYGTLTAMNSDAGRALDFPPAPGVIQNLISDLALDTSPFQWAYQNRLGANGDNPQNQLVYINITNISSASGAITITLGYVAIEA